MVRRLSRVMTARLRDESGMALVMAIGVSFTLAILGGSLILYSTSNEKIANRSKNDLRAYQLAQSGIDTAVSVIAQQPLSGGRQNPAIFSSLSTAQRTLPFGAGESVVYNGTLTDDTPVTSGTPLVRRWRWVLTGTSTVPNPNAGGAPLTRTVTATMLLSPRAAAPIVDTQAWKYIYSNVADASNATCEVTLPNNPNFNSSFYVNGTLCLTNSGEINGNVGATPAVDVIAKGGIYLANPQSYIGKTRTIQTLETPMNGCKYRTGAWGACNPANHVTASSVVTPWATNVPGPTTSFPDTALLASPGPQNPCLTSSGAFPNFTTMNLSSTFDLTGSSYVCRTTSGELSYDSASRVLTIKGLIYFPGDVVANGNIAVLYQGVAAIYVAGSYNQRQTALCAKLSGSQCDWTNWDTTNNVLLIAAAGGNGAIGGPSCVNSAGGSTAILLEEGTSFQGALFADTGKNICYQNLSFFQGPSVAYAQIFDNQVSYVPMPVGGVINVPFGSPGQTTAVSDYDVTPPTNYTG